MSIPLGNSKYIGNLEAQLIRQTSVSDDEEEFSTSRSSSRSIRLADADGNVVFEPLESTPRVDNEQTIQDESIFNFETNNDLLIGTPKSTSISSPMSMKKNYQQATRKPTQSNVKKAVERHVERINLPLLSPEATRTIDDHSDDGGIEGIRDDNEDNNALQLSRFEEGLEDRDRGHQRSSSMDSLEGDDNRDPDSVGEHPVQYYDDVADSFNFKNKAKGATGLSRMMSEMGPEKFLIVFGLLTLAVASLCTLATPLLIGKFIDKLGKEPPDVTGANRLVMLVVVIMSAMTFFNFANMALLWIAGDRVVTRLRKQLFSCIIYREVAFFDTTRTGELISRLSGDVSSVNTALTMEVAEIIQRIVMVVGGIIYMFYLSWDLTLVAMAAAPIIGFTGHRMAIFFHSLARRANDELAKATIVAEETISCMRTVKSMSQERTMEERYCGYVDDTFKLQKKQKFAKATQRSFVYFIGSMGVCLLLYYGAYKVKTNVMTAGDLLTFILYGVQVGEKSGQIMDNWGALKSAAGASARVFELIDVGELVKKYRSRATATIPNGIYDIQGNKIGFSDTVQGPIVFHDVCFSYPSRPDKMVVDNLNLTLEPGKTVALVGNSGGGKSTLMAMIEKFYMPVKGKVTWCGVDLKTIDDYWYHKLIGYVGQEPVLFCTSIRENILYGVSSKKAEIPKDEEGNDIIHSDTILCYDYLGKPFTQGDVERACAAANALGFIQRWPKGFNTVVGERGTSVSGGERQRISIARALLLSPPVLLLDEATAALDNESEALVQDALEKLMVGRTTLMIAHRLSTTKSADKICVIMNGKIVEQGSPDELAAIPKGHYAKLVKLGEKLTKEKKDASDDEDEDDFIGDNLIHNVNNTRKSISHITIDEKNN